MSDVTDSSGRRAYERARLALQVSYRSAGSFLISYTVDLSRGGLFLETQNLLPVGSELVLTLQIPGAPQRVVRGSVIWLQETDAPGRPVGMGIQFRDLETDFGDLIDTLVRQFLGLRIVLSSPNPRVRAQLLRMLRAAVTASIDEADSAAGPGAVWASSQYDLAVIDLPEGHQPSMDLLEALVGGEGAAAVMVIAANKELRDRAVELGAQEVIDGPVSQAELRVAVLRVLARPVILAAPAKEES